MNIGQAAEASGVKAKMIRYYESIELISAVHRTESGYRQYGQTDVQKLRFIKRARELGFSIERIRTLLELWEDRSRRNSEVRKLARQYISELDADIEKLQSIRNQLQHLADTCEGNHRPECPILDELERTARH
ncbi:Cu(I)-responsive transcriptional regulator [Noviherbaspirillum pedocola]|uniref:Cu(I)-responsive transcriptional regulator n=1 Tax=Noviherbaspirillum pedocola TaxID=2801341 RepID=A0A934SP78_9BURK|nr:Cu(I)-responsive transcriptional regulator [Noviherbaspirillum pedocola]MBK4733012.1 Cu(I)-responsive transcriptional regulator [Noviherbaspirillum pedocola]